MNVAIYLASFFVVAWMTWVIYLAAMSLKRHSAEMKQKPVFVRWFGYSVIGIGASLDVVLNLFFASVAFLDVPRELLLTSRLRRYLYQPAAGWRRRMAKYVCHNMLDLYDPKGHHC